MIPPSCPTSPFPAGAALRRFAALLLLIASLLLTACAPKNQKIIEQAVLDYHSGNYEGARQLLRPLALEEDENFVLNNVRLGSASIIDYHLEEAEAAFLRAYEVINSVGVNDGGRTLGAVLVSENIRVWKGEPFERAMANFYLGLLFYMRHDYGNARAAFENALFKLRDYADEDDPEKYAEVDSNFALAQIMLARSWQRLGRNDMARNIFENVRRQRPDLAPLADESRNAGSNILLVVEFGYGPRKVTDFDGAIVGFGPTPEEDGLIPPPRVIVDGREVVLGGVERPTVDLLALAQDRRWQSIDTIRTIKSVVGSGLMAYGAYEATRRDGDPRLGLALVATGLLLKATSQADIRQWEMLPRAVFLLPMRLPPGTHDITVEFPHARGLHQTWTNLVVPSRGEATYYLRMQRWNTGPYAWPPPALLPPSQQPAQAISAARE